MQVYLVCTILFSKSPVKMWSDLPHIVLKFSLFDFSLSLYYMLCVSFCFFPIFHAPIFLFHCISRPSYTENNDPHWYGWNSVTSISIELNEYITAHHLFCGWWNITVYVISYPVYTGGINEENTHPPTERTSVRLRDLTISRRYAQRCSTPRGMTLQRPCQCRCLSPSVSETCFSTVINFEVVSRSLHVTSFFFFLVKDKTKLSVSDKKEKRKKACSSAVFRNFCYPSNHCCPVKWIRWKESLYSSKRDRGTK